MKALNKINAFVFLLFLVLAGTACDDQWEQHYSGNQEKLPDFNLYEYINSQAELSYFAEILKTAGYDTVLVSAQNFTVWAPVNASLEMVDRQDVERARVIAQNHIARGSITTSLISSRMVRLLNGKYIPLERGENAVFSFGGSGFTKGNIRTNNGLVHEIESYVEFLPNLWEFLDRGNDLDSLREYLYGLTEQVFSPVLSSQIGTNEDGNAVYDSVFVESNLFLESRGELNVEDSVYTTLYLKNSAWNMAYDKISPYFTVPDVFGGAERGEALMRRSMISDLVFRGRFEDPGARDSLISTGGNVFYSPAYLFAGAEHVALSNGDGYLLNDFPFVDTLTWFKEIRVEAEFPTGRTNQNNELFNRSGLGTGLDVSNDRYLLLEPSGTSNFARSNVTFSIPNTLSAKYRVYVVFVPATVEDPNNLTPTKTSFQLTYVNTTTGRTQRLRVTPEDNETKPEGLTKMFVTEIDFPFANVSNEDYPNVAVNLQVTNDVTLAEETSGAYSRTMRIDCVVLEPVIE
ncbi:fasciclin domain-containing protein [Geofilum rubicundum]|uniref:FAS1 domain-containing protein n=1 Tax=Geofilum rubicundum JCM 15548 TaxID=1236989 RepID=A0A0E9LZZ9_9BACT|nr:fasciclin domain-containing protein [Geofilum rubicundum]GAO30834.1 hypothetical protein JCM15548_13148 [Geofilum rubicundum JCM 15548]